MAESFRNFNGEIAVTDGSAYTHATIIPYGISGSNESSSGEIRELNSVVQIHSIYICQKPTRKINGKNRYNPKYFSAFHLKIGDRNGSTIRSNYIVYDGRIVPGSPFFIEKNITLDPKQSLIIECPSNSYDIDIEHNDSNVLLNDDDTISLHFSASAVLFPDANL